MTLLIDSNGTAIPSELENDHPLFDADLCDFNDGRGPIISINVPTTFDVWSGTYEGDGVLFAPLKDLLEEYLREFNTEDGGDGLEVFTAWLHDYADRLMTAKNTANPNRNQTMNYRHVFTGSSETEEQLRIFLDNASSITDWVPRELFKNDYMFKVMTEGRNGPNDAHPGSQAIDDTGGFFEVRADYYVYLTEKAKKYISV